MIASSPRLHLRTIVALALLALGLPRAASAAEPAPLRTERVVLVTLDGVRVQELFGGIDPTILDADKKLSGIIDVGGLRNRFMRPSPKERREALMPFFWSSFGRRGLVLGNADRGNPVRVTNRFRVSYPGYAEILTGADQPKVASNLPFRMPRPTVLEVLKQEKGWAFDDVAVFASWQTFNLIAHREADAFFTNAGYARVEPRWATPGMEPLNTLQMQMLTPWDNVRFDRVTYGLALEFLQAHQPQLLYLAIGDMDDWGHARRYDRAIQSIHAADTALRELWDLLQSMDAYRDKTTVIVTTDHGRGLTPEDWIDHDEETPGSEATWIAVMGPDTPALGEPEQAGAFTAGQIAATLARFYGVDYRAAYVEAEASLDLAFSASSPAESN